VSNAFKYAFPDGETGKIQVQLDNRLDRYTIVVKDTGVGFPGDVDMASSDFKITF
jgi:two-component sensor histidine kinase